MGVDRLLDSYSSERRPVAQSNANFSFGNRLRFGLTDDAVRSRQPGPDPVLDQRYGQSSSQHRPKSRTQLRRRRGDPGRHRRQGTNSRYYTPSDRPGARFPHMWLDSARKHSTLDWFDKEFAVVAGPARQRVARSGPRGFRKDRHGVSLKQLPAADPADGYQLGMRGAVLVRPDGHVAWRMPWLAVRSGEGTRRRALDAAALSGGFDAIVRSQWASSCLSQKTGAGAPLVLLHGGEADHAMFDGLVRAARTAISPSSPTTSATPAPRVIPPHPIRLADLADDAAALIAARPRPCPCDGDLARRPDRPSAGGAAS